MIRATMPPIHPAGIEIVYQIKHAPGHKPQTVETVIAHAGSIGNAAIIVQALREHMGTPDAAMSDEYPLVTFYWRRPGRDATTAAPVYRPVIDTLETQPNEPATRPGHRPRWGKDRRRYG